MVRVERYLRREETSRTRAQGVTYGVNDKLYCLSDWATDRVVVIQAYPSMNGEEFAMRESYPCQPVMPYRRTRVLWKSPVSLE